MKAVEKINPNVKTIITDGNGSGYAGLIGIKEFLNNLDE